MPVTQLRTNIKILIAVQAPVFLYICPAFPVLWNTKEEMQLLPLILRWNQRRGKLNGLSKILRRTNQEAVTDTATHQPGLVPKLSLLDTVFTFVSTCRNFPAALVLLTAPGAKHVGSKAQGTCPGPKSNHFNLPNSFLRFIVLLTKYHPL